MAGAAGRADGCAPKQPKKPSSAVPASSAKPAPNATSGSAPCATPLALGNSKSSLSSSGAARIQMGLAPSSTSWPTRSSAVASRPFKKSPEGSALTSFHYSIIPRPRSSSSMPSPRASTTRHSPFLANRTVIAPSRSSDSVPILGSVIFPSLSKLPNPTDEATFFRSSCVLKSALGMAG